MEQYPQIKRYINCYLFENIDSMTNEFISKIKFYRICEFSDLISKRTDRFSNYEEQILLFFNGILENEPLRQPVNIIEQWKSSSIHSDCKFHPILPEDIIAYYTVLKETMLHFINSYDCLEDKIPVLQNELEELDADIQKLIATSFLQWQEEIHKSSNGISNRFNNP